MSELPEGWAEATTLEVCTSDTSPILTGPFGSNLGKDDFRSSGVPVFTIGALGRERILRDKLRYIAEEKAEELPAYRLRQGDLLFSRMADVGRVGFVPEDLEGSIFNYHIMRLRLDDEVVKPKFFQYYVQGAERVTEYLKSVNRGATRDGINTKLLQAMPVAVPPLPEQWRIVAKLDQLSARSAAARDHLARTTKLATRAKQAILAEALRGDLTLDWRNDRDLGIKETSDIEHLELDGSERGEWTTDILPASWGWLRFRDVFTDMTDSRRKLPQKAYAADGTYAVIDQGEKFVGGYSDNVKLVHKSEPPIIIFGDHSRCIKFVNQEFIQGADGVKVLKPTSVISDRFGYWLMRGIDLPDKGYSRHMKFLKASAFPIPTRCEQDEIVRRIDAAFSRIDRLTEEASRAAHLLDRLDERLLAKAFRGELVPQDPEDEPAEALLARIREARAAAPKTKRGRRKKAN